MHTHKTGEGAYIVVVVIGSYSVIKNKIAKSENANVAQ